jgi:hypothetical protein
VNDKAERESVCRKEEEEEEKEESGNTNETTTRGRESQSEWSRRTFLLTQLSQPTLGNGAGSNLHERQRRGWGARGGVDGFVGVVWRAVASDGVAVQAEVMFDGTSSWWWWKK